MENSSVLNNSNTKLRNLKLSNILSNNNPIAVQNNFLNQPSSNLLSKSDLGRKRSFSIVYMLESRAYNLLGLSIILIALFGFDILFCFSDAGYTASSYLSIALLVFFSTELFLILKCSNAYIYTLSFLMDLINLVLFIFDMQWVYRTFIVDYNPASLSTTYFSASTIKPLLVIRIFKNFRIIKVYQYISLIIKNGSNSFFEEINGSSDNSNVGKKLSELTTKRLITLVLTLIIICLFMNPYFFVNINSSKDIGLAFLNEFDSVNDELFKLAYNVLIEEYETKFVPLVYLSVGNLPELTYFGLNDVIN